MNSSYQSNPDEEESLLVTRRERVETLSPTKNKAFVFRSVLALFVVAVTCGYYGSSNSALNVFKSPDGSIGNEVAISLNGQSPPLASSVINLGEVDDFDEEVDDDIEEDSSDEGDTMSLRRRRGDRKSTV